MKICATCGKQTNSNFIFNDDNLCYQCAKKVTHQESENLKQQRKSIGKKIRAIWHELRQSCTHENGYRKNEVEVSGLNIEFYICNDCGQRVDKTKIQ
ncbi:hypothetical protein [Paenibacillus xylaniclasticus]|uniref:hypothetical protein n=1 Tax=Paenibacillus xylaniclasticus TaxID=588083 RepID=UPI000FDC6C4E|nr:MULTISPECIES: hypothetical protein [Paenibacillus]GFN32513.1 hypothetical protein PCURB6_27730 [Paenibacillus curdlanolyticus]